MIVPKLTSESKEVSDLSRASRKTRRRKMLQLMQEKKKLIRKLRPLNLDVYFGNDSTTSFGNYSSLAIFKEMINFRSMLEDNISLRKHWNSLFPAVDLFDYLIDACLLGKTRFEHISDLRFDPGYLKIKDMNNFPSEGRFRDLMRRSTPRTLAELARINRRLIELRTQCEGSRYVWLDFDDMVIELFGNQEEAEIGYNPRYHGRPSLKAKVCFIAGSRELLHLQLYGGKAHPLTAFPQFYRRCLKLLPPNCTIAGIRGDCGFMNEETIERIEQASLLYTIKSKITPKLRGQIMQIPEEKWDDVDSGGEISVTRMRYLPKNWRHAKELVIVRQRVEPENGRQYYLLDKEFYRYEAIMTNMEDSPEAVWHHYNRRGIAEQLIEEVKYGFGVSENSQHEIVRNQNFALVKAIAYNLMGWFKQVALPEQLRSWKAETVRRKIINVSGNIVGNGRYRHISLAPNRILEQIMSKIKVNLNQFMWDVVNGFQPLVPKPLRL